MSTAWRRRRYRYPRMRVATAKPTPMTSTPAVSTTRPTTSMIVSVDTPAPDWFGSRTSLHRPGIAHFAGAYPSVGDPSVETPRDHGGCRWSRRLVLTDWPGRTLT